MNGRARSLKRAYCWSLSAPPIADQRASFVGKKKSELSYRPCVAGMLINRQGLVWIGRRADKPNDEGSGQWWQMPQGGIDKNEDPSKTALRELYEETSVTSAEIVAESPGWYKYDLPA